MKHRMGNSTRCSECYWFREPRDGEKRTLDGYCTNTKARGINGHIPENPRPEEPVLDVWGMGCRHWEDAETRFTHYEVMTRHAEPWRSEAEKEYIERIMEEASNGKTKDTV